MKLKLAYLRYDEMGHTKAIEKKRAQAAIEYDTSTYAINRKWNLGAKQQLWVIEQALRPTVSVAMVARAAQIPRQDVIDLLYRHLNNIKRQPHKYK